MRKFLIAASTVIGCALVFAGSMDFNRVSGRSGLTMPVEVMFSKAYAGRGHARRSTRRVARRTTIRVIRITTLPGRCAWRAPYHYCGGVYYEPIVESGTTVYIVVYP
jgi:hypothetical protein